MGPAMKNTSWEALLGFNAQRPSQGLLSEEGRNSELETVGSTPSCSYERPCGSGGQAVDAEHCGRSISSIRSRIQVKA